MLMCDTQLREAGIEGGLAQRFAAYGALLLEANRRTNLTGAKTSDAVLAHLLDSLTLAPFVADPVVDVGSGGGLPAIPIALATGVRISLIEATAKKARFLEEALRKLEIAGEVVSARAEVVAHDPTYRDRFASGTIRAVAGATTSAELLLPFIAPGGVALLQRGSMTTQERTALADAALVLAAELERIVDLEGGRCIVILRKTGPTPPRFPRRTGIPGKRPLCS
jgi:16S rRNA (guanine527-N7)-methyltransferase